MVHYDSALTKKDAVYELLSDRILSGEYSGNYKFPSELVLSKELGVARITLRAALKKLEAAGLIIRLPGKGTFVANGRSKSSKPKKFLILVEDDVGSIQGPATYILPAVERNCEKRGIATDILPISMFRSLPRHQAVEALRKRGYDGVVLCSSFYNGNERELEVLRELDKPVLIPHGKPGDSASTGFAVIHADYKESWIAALKYLIGMNHRRVITLGERRENGTTDLRGFEEKEYLDFLAKEGADPDPFFLRFVPFRFVGLTKLLAQLLDHVPAPTAIMCFSDFYAMNVYDSLASLSVRIPDDIAVMGYCGFPGSGMLSPPLATVDFDYAGVGEKAVSMLDRANEWFAKEDRGPFRLTSGHEIVKRESVEMNVKERRQPIIREVCDA